MTEKIDWLARARDLLKFLDEATADTPPEIYTGTAIHAQACLAMHNAEREADKDKKPEPPLYEFDGKGGVRYANWLTHDCRKKPDAPVVDRMLAGDAANYVADICKEHGHQIKMSCWAAIRDWFRENRGRL